MLFWLVLTVEKCSNDAWAFYGCYCCCYILGGDIYYAGYITENG